MKLGEHWRNLAPYFHRFDNIVAALLLVAVAVFLYARLRGRNQGPAAAAASSHNER
jgi:hypothetical protein